MSRLFSLPALVLLAVFPVALMTGCASKHSTAPGVSAGQKMVDRATEVVRAELSGERKDDIGKLLARSKGILIIPNMGNVSFLFSVGSGSAVMLARTDEGWSGPVFLSRLEGGFGFQAGVTSTSGFVLFMHEDDVRYVLETGMVLQGNANVVIMDADMEFNRTPAFSETRKSVFIGKREGIYAGVALNGGGFTNRESMNAEYHGVEDGSPDKILYESTSAPVGVQALFDLLARAEVSAKAVEIQ